MTHDEKINYLRIAAGIAGLRIAHEHLDLLISLYDLVQEKQGDTDLKDVVRVEAEVRNRTFERAAVSPAAKLES